MYKVTSFYIEDYVKTAISGFYVYQGMQEKLPVASPVDIIRLPPETVNETVADGSMYRYLIRYLREPQGV